VSPKRVAPGRAHVVAGGRGDRLDADADVAALDHRVGKEQLTALVVDADVAASEAAVPNIQEHAADRLDAVASSGDGEPADVRPRDDGGVFFEAHPRADQVDLEELDAGSPRRDGSARCRRVGDDTKAPHRGSRPDPETPEGARLAAHRGQLDALPEHALPVGEIDDAVAPVLTRQKHDRVPGRRPLDGGVAQRQRGREGPASARRRRRRDPVGGDLDGVGQSRGAVRPGDRERVHVVAPHVLPLFEPFSPQVLPSDGAV
jgi:hypothetical protein